MSMKAVAEFMEAAAKDASIGEAARRAVDACADEEATAALAAVARQHGFDVTDAEMREAQEQEGPLSDDELEDVNGGHSGTTRTRGRSSFPLC